MRQGNGRVQDRFASCSSVSRLQAGKMLVPLLGVMAFLATLVAVAAIYLQMKERDLRLAKEKELGLAVQENDNLKREVEDLEGIRKKAEEDLSHAKKDLTQSQQDLAKAVEAQQALSKQVEDREQEIARLNKDLEQAKTQQKQAADQVAELQAERDRTKQQLGELEKAKSDLETKIAQLSERPTVELDKVVVGDQPSIASGSVPAPGIAAAGQSPGSGQVVVVNREYDFIVMNIGKNHGLSIGQEFKIVRGSEVLGKVKVEKVYDELSAAAILPESKKENIREGDAVVAL